MKEHEIIKAVRDHFNIDTSQRTRRREVVDARMAMMVALRATMSMQDIGQVFKFKKKVNDELVWQPMSHCTVVYAVKHHKWRYHPEAKKRLVSYRLYGEIFDFVQSHNSVENYTHITQQEMEQRIDTEVYLRKQAEHRFDALNEQKRALEIESDKAMKSLNTKLKKSCKERDHYKVAFTQLYNEKKIRDEKDFKKASA